MHITIKRGFELQLSSEWNVESVQNLKFPEDMIEVTQIPARNLFRSTKDNNKIRRSDQSIKQKINIKIGQTPDNLKI